MSVLTVAALKALWINGFIPTETDYVDLFDTMEALAAEGEFLPLAGTIENTLDGDVEIGAGTFEQRFFKNTIDFLSEFMLETEDGSLMLKRQDVTNGTESRLDLWNTFASISAISNGQLSRLTVGNGEILVRGANALFKGLQGLADYSANYDNLSYVQKAYLVSYVAQQIAASNPDLQAILDAGGVSNSPDGFSSMTIGNGNESFLDFVFDSAGLQNANFYFDKYGFLVSVNENPNGGEIIIDPTTAALRRVAGVLDTYFKVGDPKADNVTILLNTPADAAANAIYYIPLKINGQLADVNGNVTIPAIASTLQAVLDAGGYAESPNFNSFIEMLLSNDDAGYFNSYFFDTATQSETELLQRNNSISLRGFGDGLGLNTREGVFSVVNGEAGISQSDAAYNNTTRVLFLEPIATTILNMPAKAAGTYTLATLADVGIKDIVEDTTPQLGGTLDLNGQKIEGVGDINITGAGANSSAMKIAYNLPSGAVKQVDLVQMTKTAAGGSDVTFLRSTRYTVTGSGNQSQIRGHHIDITLSGSGAISEVAGTRNSITHNGTGAMGFLLANSNSIEVIGTGAAVIDYIRASGGTITINNTNATVNYAQGGHPSIAFTKGTLANDATVMFLDIDVANANLGTTLNFAGNVSYIQGGGGADVAALKTYIEGLGNGKKLRFIWNQGTMESDFGGLINFTGTLAALQAATNKAVVNKEFTEATYSKKLNTYNTSNIPAGAQGDEAFVTDATAPEYLKGYTGGGDVFCKVLHNGANWVTT